MPIVQTSHAVATGARIKGFMASRSITQAQVAAHLGLSQPAVSRRLRGEVPFNVDEIHSLAALFKTTVTRLMEDVDAEAVS